MNRILRLVFVLLLANYNIAIFSQVQQGYVKTLGRPNQKGIALGGVSIRARGSHNVVLSRTDGCFSMQIHGKSYVLQQVQKNGYELIESGIIGRQYAYSASVPLTVVMVSSKQFQRDKQRIEDNAYAVAERNYKLLISSLEKEKKQKRITIAQYRKQIQDLQEKFDKYQVLIEDMAKHYALTDYDELDETERNINISIENGDLERADSLIRQTGFLQHVTNLLERKAIGQQLIIENDERLVQWKKQMKKDGQFLYQLYTIELGRFSNTKAQEYIEKRAALDTTNVQWQIDAGNFFFEYLSDYKKAKSYYQRSFREAQKNKDDNGSDLADVYESLGNVFGMLGDNNSWKNYILKAISIKDKLYGKQHTKYAESCVTMGVYYTAINQYKEALDWFEIALQTLKQNYGELHENVAVCYGHIGNVYLYQGKLDNAEKSYNEALRIREKVLKKNSPAIARNLNHLAAIELNRRHSFTAQLYLERALDIYKHCYGEPHHTIALLYFSYGQSYLLQNKNEKALDFFKKSVETFITIFGTMHHNVGSSFINFGQAYYNLKDYKTAQAYFQEALNILQKTVGEDHPDVGKAWEWMGAIAFIKEDYSKALDYYRKALAIYKNKLGNKHPTTKNAHNSIMQIKTLSGLNKINTFLGKISSALDTDDSNRKK